MEIMKSSESMFNFAAKLEEDLNAGAFDKELEGRIRETIEVFLDYAEKIKENEIAAQYNRSMAEEYDGARRDNEEEIDRLAKEANDKVGFEVFSDMTLAEKVEFKDTISAHLKRALELLVEKGKEKSRIVGEKSKGIIDGMTEKVINMYDSSIDFIEQKKEETKAKIAAKKEEKKALKEQAIEQLKELGKEDEILKYYIEEKDEIKKEIDGDHAEQEQIEDKMKLVKKNAKALVKYEKKNFISRFLSNFSELADKDELSEEQKKNFLEKGGVPKKMGFFAKAKQAFSKAKEQGKEIKGKNDEIKEGIMKKFESELEKKNAEISELENILAQNEEQREAFETEKKEKLVEVVKMGKIKVKELQDMIENEVVLCSNPHMIVAQAKLSSLKDTLSRWIGLDKEKKKEVNKDNKENTEFEVKKTTVRVGMDR